MLMASPSEPVSFIERSGYAQDAAGHHPFRGRSRNVFAKLKESSPELRIESFETVGLLDKLQDTKVDAGMILVSHVWQLDRLRTALKQFDAVVLTKVPFDPGSRPLARVMAGDNGFTDFTLPRTIFRLKETLHSLSLAGKPIVIIDNRIGAKDYGRTIVDSLLGWEVSFKHRDEV